MNINLHDGEVKINIQSEMLCKRHLDLIARTKDSNLTAIAFGVVQFVMTSDVEFAKSLKFTLDSYPADKQLTMVENELKAHSPLCCRLGDEHFANIVLVSSDIRSIT